MLSPFGVEHPVSKGFGGPPTLRQEQRLSPAGQKVRRRSQDVAGLGLATGTAAHVAAARLYNSGRLGDVNAHAETIGQLDGSRNLSRLSSNARKIKAGTRLMRGGTAAALTGLGALGVAGALGSRAKHKVTKSAFGVEQGEVCKSDRAKDSAAAGAGAALGATVAPKIHRRRLLRASVEHIAAFDAHERAATELRGRSRAVHRAAADRHLNSGFRAARRVESTRSRVAAGAVGAGVGAAGALAARRSASGRVHKSAFGVEHSLATGVTPARLRLTGPQVPPQAGQAKPAKPPAQRLNNAIAATGGPSS